MFYGLLSNYKVERETLTFDDNNNIYIDAEFVTSISKYKVLSKILSKLINKKMLHLETKCNFINDLKQIKFKTKPKIIPYFDCSGVFYCDDDYNVLSHEINLIFNDKYKIVKMFEEKIRESILKQIKYDIDELKQLEKLSKE
jgi:hypothetical protein